ncbi:hypothetical protein RJ640_000424 [Escallonia rubra]|uniref:Uncharacterized protein n=1 Tax=Escallonia rubra TaxID=112253 RepID=A0AA88UBS3_9ASTE|nr:hypothetical protein RJ640_000424 [Escallonia rubra]
MNESLVDELLLFRDQQFTRWLGIEGEIGRLAERLVEVQALFCRAESKGPTTVEWMNSVDTVAYDAGAVLDALTYYEANRKEEHTRARFKTKVRNFIYSSKNPIVFRRKMARMIDDISDRLHLLCGNGPDNLGVMPAAVNSDQPRYIISQEYSLVQDSVERDHDTSAIVDQLLSGGDGKFNLPVVAIVGMGGIGKTTLAKRVYNSKAVSGHFDERMWVCVSDDFDVTRLLGRILEFLIGTHLHMLDIEEITQLLRENLNGKKYLLVLDDVWSDIPHKWESMRRALLNCGTSTGSTIVVTARSHEVADATKPSYLHKLLQLDDDKSWMMLSHIAFAVGGATWTPELDRIGKQLVKRCRGVPLALKVFGGLLYTKKDKWEWLSILDGTSSSPSSIWRSGSIFPSLMLSYIHLPSMSLKNCFAYCSLFPKDWYIEKERLVQLWMAAGFLHPPDGSGFAMEDVGHNFFNTLLSRSFLEDARKDEDGNVIGCKMHDHMHDLALDVSKGSFLSLNANELKQDCGAVHLSLTLSEGELPESLGQRLQRLQTLFLYGGVLTRRTIINFKRLRVLFLVNKDIKELPSSIVEAKYLKYLDISRTSIHTLPDCLTLLYNLQTLRVTYMEKLPKTFGNLISLRHFCIRLMKYQSRSCKVYGVGRLTCLQTLPIFVVSQERGCQIKELGGLEMLKGELRIHSLEYVRNMVEARQARLSEKAKIHALGFHWGHSRGNESYNDEDVLEGLKPHLNLRRLTIEYFKGESFAPWMMTASQSSIDLHNLVKIKLKNCSRCERLPTLGHLPYLKVVDIEKMDGVKFIGAEFYGQNAVATSSEAVAETFPALRKLTLSWLGNLEEWYDAAHSSEKIFPHLTELAIKACPKLKTAPSHFQGIKKLSISGIGNSLALRMMNNRLDTLISLEISSVKGDEFQIVLEELLQSNRSLRKLKIVSCDDLSYLPDNLGGLTCLETLVIEGCDKLTTLNTGLEFCTSLEDLSIRDCPALVSVPDLRCLTRLEALKIGGFSKGVYYFPRSYSTSGADAATVDDGDIQHLLVSTLKHLELDVWPKLKSLPEQLQHLSALKSLHIIQCDVLEALPEWLGNLSSLEDLHLLYCRKLKSWPSVEAMRRLTNLRELHITWCPELKKICMKGSGPDWYKIAHISTINIDYDKMDLILWWIYFFEYLNFGFDLDKDMLFQHGASLPTLARGAARLDNVGATSIRYMHVQVILSAGLFCTFFSFSVKR